MNLKLAEDRVRKHCESRNIVISAIEPLPEGGTHLVCMTIEGADEVRLKLGEHLIAGAVKRIPFYRAIGAW